MQDVNTHQILIKMQFARKRDDIFFVLDFEPSFEDMFLDIVILHDV